MSEEIMERVIAFRGLKRSLSPMVDDCKKQIFTVIADRPSVATLRTFSRGTALTIRAKDDVLQQCKSIQEFSAKTQKSNFEQTKVEQKS